MPANARATTSGLVGLALFVAALFFLAPVQLGGSTSFVVTEGISMLPGLHTGDLAVVRSHSSYRVGEAVLYHSPVLHRPVLHRIIAVRDGRYFFQGDNNDFVDPGSVPKSALAGELWFHVPHMGKWVAWLSAPLHVAIVVAGAAFLLLLGNRKRRRRGRRRRGTSGRHVPSKAGPHTSTLDLSGWMLPLAALALLCGALAAVGFSKPAHRIAEAPGAYQQLGDFSYVGNVVQPSVAYPSGHALTGQPLLLNLFRRADVRFNYQFATGLPHHIHGTIKLSALVAAQTSWHQTFPVAKAIAFSGDAASIGGTVDLRAARAFLDQVSVQSGSVGADYDVDLRAIVHISGLVGDKRIDETFNPVLPFTFNHQLVKLRIPTGASTAGTTYNAPADTGLSSILNPRSEGGIPHRVSNSLTFAHFQIPVLAVRWVGLGLAALALLAIYTVVLPQRARRTRREHEQIQGRFGRLIVPAVAVNPDARPQVALADFPSLVRLARHYEHLILHEERDGRHTYAVDEDGRLYTYCIDPATRAQLAPGEDRRGARSAAPVADRRGAPPAEPAGPPAPRPRREWRRWLRPAGLLLAIVLSATLVTSITASNTVPVSHAGKTSQALAVSQLAPIQCAGLSLTSLVVMPVGASSVTGTGANDLILGRARSGSASISGGGGDDCMVGGGGSGTKSFVGGSGNDVCIGAVGSVNTFSSCSKSYN